MTRPCALTAAPLAFALFLAGCGGNASPTSPTSTAASTSTSTSTSTPTPSPTPTPTTPPPTSGTSGCALTVTGMPTSVSSDGGRFVLGLSIPTGCAWTARPDLPWADVAPGSGDRSATLTLTIERQTTRDARTLTVTVNDQSFRIVQFGVGCTYEVRTTALDLGPDGGTASVPVIATAGCTWGASASEGWLRVQTPSGSGNGTVLIDVAANPGDVRHAFLTIAGFRVSVTQQPR